MKPDKKNTSKVPNQNQDKFKDTKKQIKDDKQGKDQMKDAQPRNPNEFIIHYVLSTEQMRQDKYEKELKMFEKKQEMSQKKEEEMRKKMAEKKGDYDSIFGFFGININLSMLDKNEPKFKRNEDQKPFCNLEEENCSSE